MIPINETDILAEIEFHELMGNFSKSARLKNNYQRIQANRGGVRMKDRALQTMEGTLVAAGWDDNDQMNLSSLYTQESEDILLSHLQGIKTFKPYLNQKVKIVGRVISNKKDSREVLVKHITRLADGFSIPLKPIFDEFHNRIIPMQ